jgi:hypothetical protein
MTWVDSVGGISLASTSGLVEQSIGRWIMADMLLEAVTELTPAFEPAEEQPRQTGTALELGVPVFEPLMAVEDEDEFDDEDEVFGDDDEFEEGEDFEDEDEDFLEDEEEEVEGEAETDDDDADEDDDEEF